MANDIASVDIGASSMPRQIVVVPPGGAFKPVDDLSVSTLPQFWLEPVAKAFEEAAAD
jgi:hypothetical protein